MDVLTVVFFMVASVLLSGLLDKVLPFNLPLPLIQIILGFCIAAFTGGGVDLHPDIFFLLFLPPLLFLDGWRIPKDGLIRERSGVLQLAFVLVFFTVLGLGYFIHWMIPAMPLPVAFALAAIVSPTDPVAVSAITRRTSMPPRAMLLLESESLFNDASGLVAFRFAVAAALTGTFSLSQAVVSFVWLALGGLAIGFIVTRGIIWAQRLFVQRYGEDSATEVLLSLLTPFVAYFIAEELGASGILAAVAAGVTTSYAELSGRAQASTRVHRKLVWDVLQFVLNGIMFVLLGEQLPKIFRGAVDVVQQTGHHSVAWLVVYPLAICAVLILLRFVWVFSSVKITRALGFDKRNELAAVNRRMTWVLSLAGARGTITLAGVLTLPLLLPDGQAFPARDLAIFLAAMVILVSLLVASIGLPWLLKDAEPIVPVRRAAQEALVLKTAQHAAAERVRDLRDQLIREGTPEQSQLYTEIADFILSDIRGGYSDASVEDNLEQYLLRREIERQMRLAATDASRQAIFALARQHRISDELAREQVHLLDLLDVRLR